MITLLKFQVSSSRLAGKAQIKPTREMLVFAEGKPWVPVEKPTNKLFFFNIYTGISNLAKLV